MKNIPKEIQEEIKRRVPELHSRACEDGDCRCEQDIAELIEERNAQSTEFANLLREHHDWIWGTICKKCSGTGMVEQENCSQCRATGIDNWNIEGFIEQFLKTNQTQ